MGDMENNNVTGDENMDTAPNSNPNPDTSQENFTEDSQQNQPNPADDDNESNTYVNLVDSLLDTVVVPSEPEKKKFNGKLAALIIIIGIVLLGSITAYANRNAIVNTLSRMTKSPTEYYAYIEQKGMEKGIDKLTSVYKTYLDQANAQFTSGASQDLNMKLTINPQFTSMLGLTNFESVEAKISALSKNGNSKSTVGFFYNEKTLLSLNTFMNAETSNLYLNIPELSSAYLMFSLDELMQESGTYPDGFNYREYVNSIQSFVQNESLSPEVLNTILDKYTALIIKNIDDVTLDKNIELKASDITSKYTKLTATITAEDAFNIANNVLTEAKTDKSIIDLCTTLDICTEEEYSKAIDDAMNDLNSSKETMTATNDTLIMSVYVDNYGNIMGREFQTNEAENASSLGYYLTHKGKDIGYTAWLTEGDVKVFDFTGKETQGNNGATGSADVKVSEYNDTYGDNTTYSCNIAYENVKYLDDKGHINGKFTITSDLLTGMSLIFDCSADAKKQAIKMQLLYGGIEAGTLDITTIDNQYQDFELPSDSEQIFGSDDYQSYLSTVDFDSFISSLENVLGVDNLDTYFEGLISNFMY